MAAMSPPQFSLFYFHVLKVNAANDVQRVILLSSVRQICRRWWKCVLRNLLPQEQRPWPIAVLQFNLGSLFDRNRLSQKPGKMFRNRGLVISRERYEGRIIK